ncbi:MAG: hypothetical protein J0I06_17315, partial [Planctomycetes bacterium]|nr:hypothetical protein [Planctomycetota bacterium]
PAGTAQDGPFGGLQPHYWPHRKFDIPINTDAIAKLTNKPTHLQLYYAVSRGAFQKGPKLSLGGLNELRGSKKGFEFEAPRDGDYEFAVQYSYDDGTVAPKEAELSPEMRAIIDTVPPRVQLAAVGNGVEWVATDENLDPQSVTLECKWPTDRAWTPVRDKVLRPSDSYAWKMPPGKVLEVRVTAKDRAGHEGVSPVVRVPGDPATAVGLPKNVGGPGWVGAGTGAVLPQPRIDYVNALEFQVDYTVQRMGRSGVQAAHLFVLKDQGGWELVKRHPVKLTPDDKGAHSLSLPYKAAHEGTYGFYVIPESGAGKRAEDPKKDDPPMVLVVVDTTKPHVKITGVQVKPGGVRGPLVEFTWEAADANLMPQPVSLEWSLSKDAEKWNEVKYRLDNTLTRETGRYAWEVPDEKLWKFWVRARAVDKAANVGEHVWPQEVIVDLEKPSATIDRIRGGGPAPKAPEKAPEKPPEKVPDKQPD